MAQTITEQIFSRRVGHDVRPGDVVVAPVDFVFSHDGNRPQPLETFRSMGGVQVFDPSKVAMFLDHAPNVHTPAVAEMHRRMREFAEEQGITLFPAGRGISHQVLPEEGYALPGRIIVGSDSHTCTAGALNLLATGVGSTDLAVAMMLGKLWFKVPPTIRFQLEGALPVGVFSKDLVLHLIALVGVDGATYRAVEFHGPAIGGLGMDARMTVTNMAVEMGAKFGIMEADDVTRRWLRQRSLDDSGAVDSDPGAEYEAVHQVDAGALVPVVAEPPTPDRVRPAADLGGVAIQQATIGTSANGQLDDLRAAARVLEGHHFAPGVKVYITAASQRAYLAARREGLVDLFLDAGAVIGTPGCSGCTGASGFGVPADGETMITSANRNFIGRTGNSLAEIYLASPATVMASAIAGSITDPRPFLTPSRSVGAA
ncbi:MAG: homoaconitate hydratase family protein [Propionibacteriales bacterium]|nr:homoaconitate hydratase family protein [Propionibacteriales bacterium]